jgi:hypothetical protein
VQSTSQGSLAAIDRSKAVIAWCLPCLLFFVLFLFSFPIDRKIPFWPRLSLAECFFLWFLFVTPITTTVALIVSIKNRKLPRDGSLVYSLSWAAIIASFLMNLFILFALWAAFYF